MVSFGIAAGHRNSRARLDHGAERHRAQRLRGDRDLVHRMRSLPQGCASR